ncbi:hypothetical protein [Holzapfeliella floricola]|uniref:hypothetical protein n=1 Tax=Holzapfeliella floricola TaxID=679249 RepID=UPI000780A26C|nr:hypothetical protein [Holzapfeliella floricola]
MDNDQRSQFTKGLAEKTSELRQSILGAQNTADLETKKSEIVKLDDFAKNTKLANDKAKAAHDLKTKAQEVKNNLDKLPGLTKAQIESAQKSIDDKLSDGLKGDFVTNKDNILSDFTNIFNTQKKEPQIQAKKQLKII